MSVTYRALAHRLESSGLGLSAVETQLIVARAWGHSELDPVTYEPVRALEGMSAIPAPATVKSSGSDRALFFTHVLRMAVNLGMPHLPDVRQGLDERQLVAAMWGESSFDAVLESARLDGVDPHGLDEAMGEKHLRIYGTWPFAWTLFGRAGYCKNMAIIGTDYRMALLLVDQELALTNPAGLRVGVVRKEGSISPELLTYEEHVRHVKANSPAELSSALRGAPSFGSFHVETTRADWQLTDLLDLYEHWFANNPCKSLIVDQYILDKDTTWKGLKAAKARGVNLVLSMDFAPVEEWARYDNFLLFNHFQADHPDIPSLTQITLQSSLFHGIEEDKIRYVFYSQETDIKHAVFPIIFAYKPQPNIVVWK